VIRTRGNPLKSRPNRWLAISSLGAIAVAALLPYTLAGRWFGFASLPLSLLATLAGTTMAYLVLAEIAKRWFYRYHPIAG
ncbi:MAG TPA: cation transporting ATPase C-terminal domain-containing protein, partial [Candidatus Saccharimonadales bacterium]|nr:cation transporting ATPase C-terminal domain-containing protein [Candidatus Saccharimonadales bacterium]